MSEPGERRTWHTRGYLPHFDDGISEQFITFRLAHSVPRRLIDDWRAELARLPSSESSAILRQRVESFLDGDRSVSWLSHPRVAAIVEENLLHFDGQRYHALAWVVMPNHVHVLIAPLPGWSVSAIVHAWKSYTANMANKILARTGQFWHVDYFDRAIRDERHRTTVVRYIEHNPVKAGLCSDPGEWPYSSARLRAVLGEG